MNKKRIIAILTLMCFLFTLVPVAAMAEGNNDSLYHGETTAIYYVSTAEGLGFALSGMLLDGTIPEGGVYSKVEIIVTQNIELTRGFVVTGPRTILLKGNTKERTIKFADVTESTELVDEAGNMFRMKGVDITIENIILDANQKGCLFRIESINEGKTIGALKMENGATLQNGYGHVNNESIGMKSCHRAGAIRLDSNTSFIMNGGLISMCGATSTSYSGAIAGWPENTTIVINDGEISNCKSAVAGAVCLYGNNNKIILNKVTFINNDTTSSSVGAEGADITIGHNTSLIVSPNVIWSSLEKSTATISIRARNDAVINAHIYIDKNVILYKEGERSDNYITCITNGGTIENPSKVTADNFAVLTKGEYSFAGWYTDGAMNIPVENNTPIAGNTYYAKWVSEITLDANEGTLIGEDSITVDEGKTISTAISELPTPIRTGYIFNGWYTAETGGEEVELTTIPTGDATYHAQWTECTHENSENKPTTCIDSVTCTVCDGIIVALPHDFSGAWVTTDAAYHWKVCNDCDAEDTENKVEHSYTYTSDAAAHDGVCVCGRTVTNEEHEYTNECDTDCNVCGYVRTIEHDYKWVVDQAATESATGLKHEECTVCHATRNVDTVIDKTPSTSTSSGFSGSYNYPVSTPTVDNGDVKLSDSNAVEGESVTATVTPDNGYGVAEVIVTDEDGNIIPVEFVGNGQYTFVMPAGKVNIETICKPAIVMTIGDTELNIFGETMTNDVAPTIGEGNRTMLPIRAIANALGAEVYWDAENQKVTIVKDGKVIEVFIGEDYAFVDGERLQLDAKAYIENNRTYLQVRFITEALDADVIWDPVKKTVTIIPE